ncbi:MAG: TolC family protein [Bacteroidia bacterium]
MLALCLLPVGMYAQAPLSLGEALARALENNFGIQIADRQVDLAEAQNTWGQAGRWPSLDLGVAGSFFRSGNPGAFVPGRENINTELRMNWTLFDGFRVSANKARFDLLEAQSSGNAAVVVENTLQAVILGYYNVVLSSAQIEVLVEVLRNSRERLDYEQYRQQIGSGSTFEVLQFRTAWLADSANLLNQQLLVRDAVRTLNLLMGEDEDAAFRLTDTLPPVFQPYSWEVLRGRLLDQNNSLRNQAMTLALREQETRIAAAAYYPSLAVNSSVVYSAGRLLRRNFDPETSADMPTIPTTFNAFDFTAGFALSFNLFDGGNRNRTMEIARINEHIAQTQQAELEQRLLNELRTQWDSYEVRRQLYALQSEALLAAEAQLAQAADRYRNGLINAFDYRTLQLQYLNTSWSYLRARWDASAAETELIRLTGGLLRP